MTFHVLLRDAIHTPDVHKPRTGLTPGGRGFLAIGVMDAKLQSGNDHGPGGRPAFMPCSTAGEPHSNRSVSAAVVQPAAPVLEARAAGQSRAAPARRAAGSFRHAAHRVTLNSVIEFRA